MKAKFQARQGIAVVLGSAPLIYAANLVAPKLAFASESEASGIAAILPDPVEFLPMLVAFIILAVILAKFGWPAFDQMLEKRAQTISDQLEKSEAARVESERILAEYQKQLADAKSEAAKIIADAKEASVGILADATTKAQAESDRMIEKAQVAIETEKKNAIAELQSSLADVSIDVASRLIGEGLTTAEHRALIKRYVEEAGSFNGN